MLVTKIVFGPPRKLKSQGVSEDEPVSIAKGRSLPHCLSKPSNLLPEKST